MNSSNGLPASWVKTRLGDVTSKPQYGWTTKASRSGNNLRLLRTSDISSGRVSWADVPHCELEPKDPTKYFLNTGDIVVARAGSVGKSFLMREDVRDAVFASYLVRFTPRISSEYVHFFMQSRRYWEQIEEKSAGIAIPNVNASKLSAIKLPLPPLGEQERIVEKIEALFAELDKGEESLRQVQTLLASYRQSVLKAAVTGELTADWRAERAGQLEHGRDLLDRILKARRENWQGRGKYKEPADPDAEFLFDVPATWEWASLSQLSFIKGGITVDRKREPADPVTLPYLRVANVQNGYLDLGEIKEITVDRDKAEQCLLEPGDILLNEGGDRDKLGRGWVWSGEIDPCIHQNHVFRARPVLPELCSKFISYYSNAFGQPFFMRKGRQSVNLASISMTAISGLPIPLPSIEEQEEIVNAIETKLATVSDIVKTCEAEFARSAALRQSILKDAFSGKLVPQDPNDEPAAQLLARIKAASTSEAAKPRRKTTKTTENA